MSEEIEPMKASLLKIFYKQGFPIFLMGLISIMLYVKLESSENTQREDSLKKDALVQEQISALKEKQDDCNQYSRDVMEDLIRENLVLKRDDITLKIEIRDELRKLKFDR